jgi:2-methylcitrate dehydratase PrpD
VPGLTASLGKFAAEFATAPQQAAAVAKTGIIDAIGVMLAARDEPVVRAIQSVALEGTSAGSSSVLLSSRRARAADAALVNGTAAHAFAMDDVACGCHPSAVLMPAIVAEGEAIGASGADALRAYVVGYEVLAEMAAREPDAMQPMGWHPTAVLGPIAATAALCSLRRLSAAQSTQAIGIAASMTGGLVVNFGTQTKAMHAGRAASAGVMAVRLAAEGVTSAPDALERATGLLRVLSPAGRVDVAGEFGRTAGSLRIVANGISIKKYPICYSLHRVADAAIELGGRDGFRAADVERIEVSIGKTQAWMAGYHRPSTPLEAKYSVEFAVASGLVARAAGFEQLDESFVRSALIQKLIAATSIELRHDAAADDPIFSAADRVLVHMTDGRLLDSGEVPYARGNARLPLTEAELHGKFAGCVASGGRQDADRLYGRLLELEHLADLRSVAEA